MTVPGGVPNLPALALTLDNIASRLQDMTPPAIRNLANQGLPAIFDGSNGGNVLSDFTPFGVITRLFAEFAAAVAKADPNDIQGPEDLPGLMLDFIEGLPIIGELVGLLEAIGGTYDGDDAVLLAVQEIFYPIRKLLQLVSGQPVGFPTVEEVTVGWTDLGDALVARAAEFAALLAATGQATAAQLGAFINQIQQLIDAVYQALNGGVSIGNTVAAVKAALQAIPGGNIIIAGTDALPGYLANIASTGLYDASVGFNNLATSLLKNLTPTGGNIGQFDAAGLAGTINSAAQIGSTAISSIFNGTGQFIGVLNSAATGALGNAVTIGGQAVSSLFNGSGQFIGVISSAATGVLNTALLVGGTALGTLATNWNAAVTNINSLIGGVTGASTVADVATNINLAATNIAQIGTAAQNAAAGIVGSLNTAATQVQTAFSGVLNGIFGGLMGNSVTPTATTQSLATTAMNNVTSNIVGNASALMAIQAQQVQQAALMSVKFNFADYPNGALPSSFTIFPGPNNPGANGSLEIIGGRVVYKQVAGASAFSTQMARYNVTPATTDYQEVSWTTTGDTASAKTFFVRMNAAGTSGIWIDTSQFTVTFQAVVSGVFTILGAITITPGQYKSGAKYTVRIGDLSNLYKFFLYENDTLIGSVTDASHVSQLGALYRYGALSLVDFNTGPLFDQGINSWSFGDQLFQPGAPAAAYVSTSQATTSTTYADLTTTTDTVTVNVGSSGMVQVSISAWMSNSSNNGVSWVGFALSGANTTSASDAYGIDYQSYGANTEASLGAPFLVTGLAPGATTFKMKYKLRVGGTSTFRDRRISAIPL